MTPPKIRLRTPAPGLVVLPWDKPLTEWRAPEVKLRDIPVGPHRHIVKFVEADGELYAVKELPNFLARREFAVLGHMERVGLPAVRPAGVVLFDDRDSLLVTHYLNATWQYRRLFLRLPIDQAKHRGRLLDSMVSLLVELHRHGVYWGDCSLANALFSRDGQVLKAWFVDAETSEVHASLSDGQRRHDVDILIENVALGMVDLAARHERADLYPDLIAEARSIGDRYDDLWDVLHAKPTFAFNDRYAVEGTIRRLNELGFVVDELDLEPTPAGELRLSVEVGDRNHHSNKLRRLAGLDVSEGQATILLGDFHAYRASRNPNLRKDEADFDAAARWVLECLNPGMQRAHAAIGGHGDPIQAYCDLLEVRWLLSERAGHDVGIDAALAALGDAAPTDSAARMSVADIPTGPLPVVDMFGD